MRVEHFEGELHVLRVELDPTGVWHHSSFPDEMITLDYDDAGRLIGFELLGSRAESAARALVVDGLEIAREEPAVQELLMA